MVIVYLVQYRGIARGQLDGHATGKPDSSCYSMIGMGSSKSEAVCLISQEFRGRFVN